MTIVEVRTINSSVEYGTVCSPSQLLEQRLTSLMTVLDPLEPSDARGYYSKTLFTQECYEVGLFGLVCPQVNIPHPEYETKTGKYSIYTHPDGRGHVIESSKLGRCYPVSGTPDEAQSRELKIVHPSISFIASEKEKNCNYRIYANEGVICLEITPLDKNGLICDRVKVVQFNNGWEREDLQGKDKLELGLRLVEELAITYLGENPDFDSQTPTVISL
jgi:hypothetical protein